MNVKPVFAILNKLSVKGLKGDMFPRAKRILILTIIRFKRLLEKINDGLQKKQINNEKQN